MCLRLPKLLGLLEQLIFLITFRLDAMKIFLTLFLITFLFSPLFSDVRGLNGTILFDSNSDNVPEAQLTSQGLGIGVTPASNLHVVGNAIISGKLDIGGQGGSSNLNISGCLGLSSTTINSNSTLGNTSVVFADTASNNIFLELPSANLVSGRIYKVKKTSLQNRLWIVSGDNIEGFDSRLEAPPTTSNEGLPYFDLISNGSSWHIFNKSSYIKNVIGADNLVARWLLDETSGNTASDSSAYSHPGTLKGGTFSFSANTIAGKIGNALNFNGSTDYIETPYASDLNPSKFTCSFWVRLKGGAGNFRSPVTSRNASAGLGEGYIFYASDANRWAFWLGTGTSMNQCIDNTANVTYSVWTFVAGSYNGSQQLLYVNGQQVNSATVGHTRNSTKPLRIGAGATEASPDFYFNGDIDDVRIYNRALSSAEISGIYSQSN